MRKADAGLELTGVGPQGCEAAARPLVKGDVGRIERVVGSTPFRPSGGLGTLDKIRKTTCCSPRRASERSVAAVRNVWANESIRQKIIGHNVAIGRYRFGSGLIRRGLDVGGAHIALAQLQENTSDHGIGVLVDPLIKQRIDFLAEIGGVCEAREFVTVQSIGRSSEKKLPGRLGAIGGHGALRWNGLTRNILYRNISHSLITSNRIVNELWKNVESEEKPAAACSGCAGDYEDPDRSAWEEDFEGEDVGFQEEVADEAGPDD